MKGLRRPQQAYPQIQSEDVSKGSHYKLKKIVKLGGEEALKDIVVVISVNFLANEHNFWEEEPIQDNCIKYWRYLQAHANIAWVCEKEATVRKLVKFSKANNLRLDSVYLLLANNKTIKVPSVSYNLIEAEYGLSQVVVPAGTRQERKMIIFSGLNIDSLEQADYRSFCHSVPIVSNRKTVVHFVKIDGNNKKRFGFVIKVLTQDTLPSPYNVNRILQEYKTAAQEEVKYSECNCRIKREHRSHSHSPSHSSHSSRHENMKARLLQYLTQSLSLNLNDKVTISGNECSIQFLLGDMLRRNARILNETQKYNGEHQRYRHVQ